MIDPKWIVIGLFAAFFVGREVWMDGYRHGTEATLRDMVETRYGTGATVGHYSGACAAFNTASTVVAQWAMRPDGTCNVIDAPGASAAVAAR